jgi:hypothetical protein
MFKQKLYKIPRRAMKNTKRERTIQIDCKMLTHDAEIPPLRLMLTEYPVLGCLYFKVLYG